MTPPHAADQRGTRTSERVLRSNSPILPREGRAGCRYSRLAPLVGRANTVRASNRVCAIAYAQSLRVSTLSTDSSSAYDAEQLSRPSSSRRRDSIATPKATLGFSSQCEPGCVLRNVLTFSDPLRGYNPATGARGPPAAPPRNGSEFCPAWMYMDRICTESWRHLQAQPCTAGTLRLRANGSPV